MKTLSQYCLPLIVVVSTATVASFDGNLALTESPNFPFKLFNSISFCDSIIVGELFTFFDVTDCVGTFFSMEKIALV